MAQLKVIHNSGEQTLDKLKKAPSLPAAVQANHSPIKLKYAVAPCNFFSDPTSVTQVVVPQKPDFDLLQFDNVFFNQLRDGNLICSYPDGTIALLNNNLPAKPVKYLPLLPHNKTRSIYELTDGLVLICLENDGDESYLVNLTDGIATKLDLPPVRVCSVLANNTRTVFLGLKDGRLIAWNLQENKSTNAWQFTASENFDFQQPHSIPEITPLSTLNKVYDNGLRILGIAENEDSKLLIVFNVNNGYLTCLFDQTTSTLEHVQFTHYFNYDKIGEKVSRASFSQAGNFSLVFSNGTSLRILKDEQKIRHVEKNKDLNTFSTFAFTNGSLAFAGFKEKEEPQHLEDDNSDEAPQVDCILEIQSFGI